MRPFGWLGPSLGRSSPGPSAKGRVPQLLPPPSVPPPPQPRGPKPTRVRANPTKLPLKLTVWCRVRQTGATLGARGVPASHAALYATRLQRPPPLPAFRLRPGCPRRRRAAFPPLPRCGPRGWPARSPRAASSCCSVWANWRNGAAETVHLCCPVPETKQGHLPQR